MASIPDLPGIGLLPNRAALAPHQVYTSHPEPSPVSTLL
jgi:hypothetical protein